MPFIPYPPFEVGIRRPEFRISGGVELVMLGELFVRQGGKDRNGTTVSDETTIWVQPLGSGNPRQDLSLDAHQHRQRLRRF